MHRFEENRINEALELLNEAARDKKPELHAAIENKYTDLSLVMSDLTHRMGNGASRRYDAGKKKVTEIAYDVGESIHKNPWPYIGGVAAAALISGFLLGRSRRE